MVKGELPGGELNPGLPRDRRGYSPLYYLGWLHLFLFPIISYALCQRTF